MVLILIADTKLNVITQSSSRSYGRYVNSVTQQTHFDKVHQLQHTIRGLAGKATVTEESVSKDNTSRGSSRKNSICRRNSGGTTSAGEVQEEQHLQEKSRRNNICRRNSGGTTSAGEVQEEQHLQEKSRNNSICKRSPGRTASAREVQEE